MIVAVLLTVGTLGIGTGVATRQVLAVGGEQPSAQAAARTEVAPAADDDLFAPFYDSEPVQVAQDRERVGRRDGTPHGKEVRGRLKAIDLEKGTLTVFPTRDGNREDETYSLAGKDVQVKNERGSSLKLTDLKAGMAVVLMVSANDDVVRIQTVQAGGRGQPEAGRGPFPGGDGLRGGGVPGVLKAVDADKKTVIVTAGREGQTQDHTYQVTAKTRIAVPGAWEAKLTDLKAGMRVLAMPADDGKSLVYIMAQPVLGERGDRPGVSGRLKAVDLDKKTITLAVGRGGDLERTFTLPADVKVMGLGREPKTVADLKPGMTVGLKLAENGKDIALIYASAGEREGATNSLQGVLKGVDAAKGTITVRTGREGQEKEQTFQLAKEVRVATGRREQGKLEDLKEGMRVMLVLSRDRESVVGVMIMVSEERGRPAPPERRREENGR